MNAKLDITLTDFIYAIVVGSAFQRIDAPVASIQNFLLLIAFIVIIDDWVLYHAHAEKIPDSVGAFAKSLAIDSGVLLTWYCAAISGSHGHENGYPYLRDFLLFLTAFYLFTCFWEVAFKGITRNSARIIPDFVCALIFLSAFLTHQQPYFTVVAAILVVPWFVSRLYAWRRIIVVPA